MMMMDDCLQGTYSFMFAPEDRLTRRVYVSWPREHRARCAVTPTDARRACRYNLGAISFTPEQLAASIKKEIPEFEIRYKVDHRQKIAETWPRCVVRTAWLLRLRCGARSHVLMLLANRSLDDSLARRDWNWSHEFDLDKMTAAMLRRLRKKGVGDPARDPLMKQAASAQRKVRFCCAPAPCLVVHMALMHSRAPVLMPRLNSRSKQAREKDVRV